MIHGLCDDVMRAVMAKMQIDVPRFLLRRRIRVEYKDGMSDKETKILVTGLDCNSSPMSILTKVRFRLGTYAKTLTREQYQIVVPKKVATAPAGSLKLAISFYGNHKEPVLALEVPYKDHGEFLYEIEYDIGSPEWGVKAISDGDE